MGQQRSFGDLAQVEADRIIDEVGIESLKDIQISLEIVFRLLHLAGHLGLDFFGNVDLVVLADRLGNQGVDLPNVKGLQRITH